MGKIYSVWSPCRKTGKTLFLYMLIKHLTVLVDRKFNILVCCLNLSSGNLLNLFNIDSKELGIEDIVNFKVHPDNSSFDMLSALAHRENIYYLGSKKTSMAYANRNMRIFENLLEELRETFDLVLFDVVSGCDNSLTNMVLDKSDHIITVINQDKEALDSKNFLREKDYVHIVNKYMDIYPDIRDMCSLYGLKNIAVLPMCKELQEMKNRGKLEFYIQHDTEYNVSLKQLAVDLVKNQGFNVTGGEFVHNRSAAGRDFIKKSVFQLLRGCWRF